MCICMCVYKYACEYVSICMYMCVCGFMYVCMFCVPCSYYLSEKWIKWKKMQRVRETIRNEQKKSEHLLMTWVPADGVGTCAEQFPKYRYNVNSSSKGRTIGRKLEKMRQMWYIQKSVSILKVIFFRVSVSQYSPGWPQTCALLPQPPMCRHSRFATMHFLKVVFYNFLLHVIICMEARHTPRLPLRSDCGNWFSPSTM